MLVVSRRKVARDRLMRLLGELESARGRAVSLYLPPGTSKLEIERAVGTVPQAEDTARELTEAAAGSATGSVLLWGDSGRYLVIPPFPVGEKLFCSGYDVEPLRTLLQRDLVIAVVVVRLGAYAVGVFRGQALMSSKVGTGHIHQRHRKGGSSQRRFERRRLNEMDAFFLRVCGHVQERLGPYVAEIDHIVFGGERHTVLAFRKRCDFLHALDDRAIRPLLDIREPRQATLEAAIGDVWRSQLMVWVEGTTAEPV